MYNEISKKIDKYLQNRGEYELPKHLRMAWINTIPTKDATNDEAIIEKITELLSSDDGKKAFFDYFLCEFRNLTVKQNKTYEEYRLLDVATDFLKAIAFLPTEHEDVAVVGNNVGDVGDNVGDVGDNSDKDVPSEKNEKDPADMPKPKKEVVEKTVKASDPKPSKKEASAKSTKTPKKATKPIKEEVTANKKGRKPAATKAADKVPSVKEEKPEKKPSKPKAPDKIPAKRGRKPNANKAGK